MNRKKILLYPHGGSGNHGCEALVRSTIKLLPHYDFVLSSQHPEQDYAYFEPGLCQIFDERNPDKESFFNHLLSKAKYVSGIDKMIFERHTYKKIINVSSDYAWALSIGGDNYCYGVPGYIFIINRLLKEKGIPTVLWGCSIEPDSIDEQMKRDLAGYAKIYARESITYDALCQKGFKNVFLMPDPAFVLNRKDLPLPKNFAEGNTVGINISPMIQSHEKKNGLTMKNYESLISYILGSTDMNVALIPHVVWEGNDDRKPLGELFRKFLASNRICLIEDCNCEELKGYIARCRFIVTARTHVSIAAYSSGIPTLVIGYSVKARGLAKDLFGTCDDYVLPVQGIESSHIIKDKFYKIMEREGEIRNQLSCKSMEYNNRLMEINKDILV